MARPSQEDLIGDREHCSVDPELLSELRGVVGQQVRIIRDNQHRAIFTIVEARREVSAGIVRMGLAGRRRLGTDAEFDGLIETRILHSELSDRAAEESGEFVERIADESSHAGLIVIAPHGGDLERHTDDQVQRVCSRLSTGRLSAGQTSTGQTSAGGVGAAGVSSWWCKGFHPGGAMNAWHITAAEISEVSFPLLGTVITRSFQFAVAFHGFDHNEVLIGGLAPDSLKYEIKGAIEALTAGSGIAIRVATPDEGFGGDDPHNIVNRLTSPNLGGIQIEQSLRARNDHWRDIADAVAVVLDPKLPG